VVSYEVYLSKTDFGRRWKVKMNKIKQVYWLKECVRIQKPSSENIWSFLSIFGNIWRNWIGNVRIRKQVI
jgi:hypothetical protein